FRGELATVVRLHVDVHDESTPEHVRDQAIEFSEMVDMGYHPCVHLGGDGGSDDDAANRGIDGVTPEDATLAARIAHIGKRKSPRDTDDLACVRLTFHDDEVVAHDVGRPVAVVR